MYNLSTEKGIFNNSYQYVGGIDEAGRGPLAGPVVAACVLIDKNFKMTDDLKGVRDSKKVTEKNREKLFELINDSFVDVGVGICDSETIDRINILQATFMAMKIAISNLKIKPNFILVDGNMAIPMISTKQGVIPKGDTKIFSIAAASIIAKVIRDRMMKVYSEKYPEYGFEKHKGYGTKKHVEMLGKIGACPIHRRSFRPVTKVINKID